VPAPWPWARRRRPPPARPRTRALAGVGVLLALFCATRAGAHPHAYVDYAIALRAGTQIDGIGLVFTFDEQFSSLLRYHAQWQTGATPSERYAASLRQLPYEIDASYNGAHVALEDPEDVQFLDEGGRITCRFRVRLRTALVPPGVIVISVEDPGFYLAFALRAGDPAEVQASASARLACQRGGASSGAPRGVRCVYRLEPD
jgi:ABC-type uncharacterized transport system substrate-binding protein